MNSENVGGTLQGRFWTLARRRAFGFALVAGLPRQQAFDYQHPENHCPSLQRNSLLFLRHVPSHCPGTPERPPERWSASCWCGFSSRSFPRSIQELSLDLGADGPNTNLVWRGHTLEADLNGKSGVHSPPWRRAGYSQGHPRFPSSLGERLRCPTSPETLNIGRRPPARLYPCATGQLISAARAPNRRLKSAGALFSARYSGSAGYPTLLPPASTRCTATSGRNPKLTPETANTYFRPAPSGARPFRGERLPQCGIPGVRGYYPHHHLDAVGRFAEPIFCALFSIPTKITIPFLRCYITARNRAGSQYRRHRSWAMTGF